jgi:hypothetical protein
LTFKIENHRRNKANHSPSVPNPVTSAVHHVAMNLWSFTQYFHTHRQPVDEYTQLELDQHSRISRIRRATQAHDEELLRQTVVIDLTRRIA